MMFKGTGQSISAYQEPAQKADYPKTSKKKACSFTLQTCKMTCSTEKQFQQQDANL